jgi:hypothetical protein
VCSDICSNVFNLTCSHHAMCTLLWLLLLLLLLQPFYPGDEDAAVEKWPLRLHRYDVRAQLHYILHPLVVSTNSTCCVHKLYTYTKHTAALTPAQPMFSCSKQQPLSNSARYTHILNMYHMLPKHR